MAIHQDLTVLLADLEARLVVVVRGARRDVPLAGFRGALQAARNGVDVHQRHDFSMPTDGSLRVGSTWPLVFSGLRGGAGHSELTTPHTGARATRL
jgi:hypothetical protein